MKTQKKAVRKTFYFNTGVKEFGHFPPVPLMPGQVWRGGVKQIPFVCEGVPRGATFAFACDNDKLPGDYFVAPIIRGELHSKFAYFTL